MKFRPWTQTVPIWKVICVFCFLCVLCSLSFNFPPNTHSFCITHKYGQEWYLHLLQQCIVDGLDPMYSHITRQLCSTFYCEFVSSVALSALPLTCEPYDMLSRINAEFKRRKILVLLYFPRIYSSSRFKETA